MFDQQIQENIFSLSKFVYYLCIHTGHFNSEFLYKVKDSGPGNLEVITPFKGEGVNSYSIMMGGEIANSFTTLYEGEYFLKALFLSGLASVLIRNGFIAKYKELLAKEVDNLDDIIQNDLRGLDSDLILDNMKTPLVAIVSSLDNDIVPIRYNKHKYWGVDESKELVRCSEIGPSDYQINIDTELENYLLTKMDKDILIEISGYDDISLEKAKIIQLYRSFQKLTEKLGINIKNIPLYFSLSPINTFSKLDSSNSFFEVLRALYTLDNRNLQRKLSRRHEPWIISWKCSKCGNSSKSVLYSKLLGDGKTKIKCRSKKVDFVNESGESITKSGCGHEVNIQIPKDKEGIRNFLIEKKATCNFTVKFLSNVLKDYYINPICLVAGDIGI